MNNKNQIIEDLLEKENPSSEDMECLLKIIYIARNISLNDLLIHKCLTVIDKWFRDKNNHN